MQSICNFLYGIFSILQASFIRDGETFVPRFQMEQFIMILTINAGWIWIKRLRR